MSDIRIINKSLGNKYIKLLNKIYFSNRFFIGFLIVYSVFLLWCTFGDINQSLIAHDEGLYSRRAKLITDTNNWFAPFSSAHHKTIGSYWLIAISLKLFGVSESSVRIPSSFASILCLLFVYLITKKISTSRAALLSTLLLPSFPLWFKYSRYASPDMFFLLVNLIIVYLLILICKNSDSSFTSLRFFLVGFLIGISFFIRSFMAVIPIIALTPLFILDLRRLLYKYKFGLLSGLIIGLLPTFISLHIAFMSYGVDAITRLFAFASNQAISGNRFSGIFFYSINLIISTIPFILLYVISIFKFYKLRIIKFKTYLLYFPLIILIILSLISKTYSHYLLILLPSISISTGIYIDYLYSSYKSFKLIGLIYFLFSIFVLSLIVFSYLYNLDSLLIHQTILRFLIILASCYLASSIYIYFNHNKLKFSLLAITLVPFIQIYFQGILYKNGFLGNPNKELKEFIVKKDVSQILKLNQINLIEIDSKNLTLLKFYLPTYKIILDPELIPQRGYSIVSNNLIDSLPFDKKIISKFKNYSLILHNNYN